MKKMIICGLAMLVASTFVAPVASAAAEEKFPSKAVTLVIPRAKDDPRSVFFQALAGFAGNHLGQKVELVHNYGGGGALGTAQVARAAPDGYTIGQGNVAELSNLEMLQDVPYHWGDFSILMNCAVATQLLVVKAGSFDSVKTYLAAVRNAPLTMKFGHTGRGGHSFLLMTYFNKKAGVALNNIQYTSQGQIANALVAGEIQSASSTAEAVLPEVKAGRLAVLASLGDRRDPEFPKIPTIKELGFDLGLGDSRWLLYATKDVPAPRLKILHDAFKRAMDDAGFQAKARQMGAEPRYETGEAATRAIEQERQIIYGILKDLNLLRAGVKPPGK